MALPFDRTGTGHRKFIDVGGMENESQSRRQVGLNGSIKAPDPFGGTAVFPDGIETGLDLLDGSHIVGATAGLVFQFAILIELLAFEKFGGSVAIDVFDEFGEMRFDAGQHLVELAGTAGREEIVDGSGWRVLGEEGSGPQQEK